MTAIAQAKSERWKGIAVVIAVLISTAATPTYAWPWDDPCAPTAWNALLSQDPDLFGLYLQVLGDGCPTTPTKTVMCYVSRGLVIEADDDIGSYRRGEAACRIWRHLGY